MSLRTQKENTIIGIAVVGMGIWYLSTKESGSPKAAKNPAFVRVKKSSSIEGSNEVKANLATPTPIVIDNIPASNILKFLFLSKILYS